MNKLFLTLSLVAAVAFPLHASAQSQRGLELPAVNQEDFESGTLQGWELFDNVGPLQDRQGIVLGCTGPGLAAWQVHPGQNFELSLRMRLGSDGSAAELLLSMSGEPPNEQRYVVRLFPGETEIARQIGSQETGLASIGKGIGDNTWTAIDVRVFNGAIEVASNGQSLVTAQDPQPLPEGIFAFRCVPGIGAAIDDLVLKPASASAIPITIPGQQVQPSQKPPEGQDKNVQQ